MASSEDTTNALYAAGAAAGFLLFDFVFLACELAGVLAGAGSAGFEAFDLDADDVPVWTVCVCVLPPVAFAFAVLATRTARYFWYTSSPRSFCISPLSALRVAFFFISASVPLASLFFTSRIFLSSCERAYKGRQRRS